jgi:dihydrofolate synthase / folylpolyglutamate synthase
LPTTPFERAVAALDARGPGRMVPDLSRIIELAALLGDPQLAYPTVHVTGTNGKGSTVRMVGSLCLAAGISAGTYTSPHLQSIRERLTLSGRYVSERRFAEIHDEVAALADLVDAAARERDGAQADTVTYFELLTAMAFWLFADTPVDVGVFEVGMGGRWDATNLVRSDVAVLNEIDVDHAELGATPIEVASEKVGIVKSGSHVVTARQAPEVARLIEKVAAEHEAPLWRVGVDFGVADQRIAVGGQMLTLWVGDREIDEVMLPLHGAHQGRNAGLALAAFAALAGASFAAMDDDVVRHGLGQVLVPGRLEVVRREPTVVLDGAHNPHGARALASALDEAFGFRELIVVVACLDDKDVAGILAELREVASHVIVTEAASYRAAPVLRMHSAATETWSGTPVAVEVAENLDAALQMAESMAGPGDGVLVTGSLHTVGAARDRYLPVDPLGDDDEVVREPGDLDDATPIVLDGLDGLDSSGGLDSSDGLDGLGEVDGFEVDGPDGSDGPGGQPRPDAGE